MPRASKIVKCVDCGREFENKGGRRKPYCINCALKRSEEAGRQLRNHEGPYYEKWKASMLRSIERIKAGVEGG